MSDEFQQESIHRLESLRGSWNFELLKETIDRGSPLLAELGLDDADQVKAMLDQQPSQLESTLGVPPVRLEAIVRAVGRPSLPVRNGAVDHKANLPIGPNPEGFPADVDMLIGAVEPQLKNVGRIQFYNHHMSWGGTGWVIDREDDGRFLIVTNRHVAKLVARRTWMGGAVFMLNSNNVRYGAGIDFLKEDGRMDDSSRQQVIEEFTYVADDLAADIALARISAPSADAEWTLEPFERASGDATHKSLIGICGYPASDGSRNDRTIMDRYFQGLYDVKRFSPGYLSHARPQDQLSHDATTTGGSSGSPVICLMEADEDKQASNGKVIGLHFAGRYGVGNSAVRISTLNALLDQGASGSVFIQGELLLEGRDGSHEPDHFAGRTGYNPEFLQVQPVPLPKTSDVFLLSRPADATDDRPFELRYKHFSIYYSGAIKTPIMTALNIDGGRTQAVKDYGRWHKDLRIPAEQQLSGAEYAHDDIDRGHLVRRAATNWGANEDEANLSNRDSYHYTVAAPQHRKLNRNSKTWLGLENYILYSARTHGFRASVFTGPILSAEDPQLGETGAPVPSQFFKVVAMAAAFEDDPDVLRLHATAYVLSQGHLVADILSARGRVETTEGFEYGEYKTYQIRIRDLEEQTGHDFGPLAAADPLDRLETVASGLAVGATIEDFRQIVL